MATSSLALSFQTVLATTQKTLEETEKELQRKEEELTRRSTWHFPLTFTLRNDKLVEVEDQLRKQKEEQETLEKVPEVSVEYQIL